MIRGKRERGERKSERLTSQSVGSLPVASWRRLAQRDTSACLAPGASSSSLHEWLRKAVTSPIVAGTVLAASSVALVLTQSPEAARSAACSRLAGRQRKSFGQAVAAAAEKRRVVALMPMTISTDILVLSDVDGRSSRLNQTVAAQLQLCTVAGREGERGGEWRFCMNCKY